MRKKHGFNIIIFDFVAILFLTLSCTKSAKPFSAGELLKTDREFSALSVKEGMHKAFLTYIADSGVILRNNAWPLKGKKSLAELYSKSTDTSFVLTWEPAFEKIAAGGDIGYTYGYYKSTVKASGEKGSGSYITIWEKQPDGSWKFVLDTGTQGLPSEMK